MSSPVAPLRRLLLAVVVALGCALPASAQRYYNPEFSLGVKGGVTLSEMSFMPTVQQSWLQGYTLGVTARYTEEKLFGLIAELNLSQRGWAENFGRDSELSYQRRLTYLQLPLLTHIYFGWPKVKFFVNLGPEAALLIGDHTSANFDYLHPDQVSGFPANRHVHQLAAKAEHRFDYGIAGGLGAEFFVARGHSLMLEGRFYYGLGNIYPSSRADYFSASRGMSIEVTLGYLFRLK